ncbi:MAG: hypothetical protein ACI8QS_000467 [Planctomycetota bacterium]|jgi:hypothetical protein
MEFVLLSPSKFQIQSTMLRSFFILLLALLSLSAAPLQKESAAPFSGDALADLLSKHRHHPAVTTMLGWMDQSQFDKPEGSIFAKGVEIRFEESRVVRVSLTVSNGTSSHWAGSLPIGLTRETLRSAITSDRNWEPSGPYRQYKSTQHRLFGETRLEGIEARVGYAHARIAEVILLLDLPTYWKSYCTAIQAQIDVKQFSSDFWFGIIGGDVAGGDGELLVAWVGLVPGSASASRAGLTVTLAEDRWIDRIAFDNKFKGERPMKLGASPTGEAIIPLLGPAEDAETRAPFWHISFPEQPPTHVHLTLSTDEDGGASTLTISRPRSELVRWFGLMNDTGAPDAELVASIAELWSRATGSPKSILGRNESREGMFGTIAQWGSRLLLGNVIGGLITAPAEFDVIPMTHIEYMLRQVRNGGTTAGAALKPFAAPIGKALGNAFALSQRAAEGVAPTSVTWREEGEDPFSPGPSLSIEARKPALAADGSAMPGFDLYLVIRIPE